MINDRKHLFRIGELSKIFHLPVKTLRYYSDIGLIIPAYIDQNTGYRYYSIDQFVLIDIIRNSRRMGMSLERIGDYIRSDIQAPDIADLLDTQIDVIEQKIEEYRLISDSMKSIRESITKAISQERNIPYISQENEQYYMSYPYQSDSMEEQELNFRKAALSGGENNNQVYTVFGTSTLSDEYFATGKIINPDIRRFITDRNNADVMIQPAGKYVCIVFDDNVHNKEKYYALIKRFIVKNKLKPIGDFIEEWIIPRVKDGMESTLIKIKIQIKA